MDPLEGQTGPGMTWQSRLPRAVPSAGKVVVKLVGKAVVVEVLSAAAAALRVAGVLTALAKTRFSGADQGESKKLRSIGDIDR